MGYPVTQSQTAQPLVFFMTDSSDHISGKTGLSPAVTISKNGGAFASPSGAVSEIANGWYKVAGNATDAATLGPLLLHATGSGADPFDDCFPVVAYSPQDAAALGLTNLDAAITSRAPASTALSTAQWTNALATNLGTLAGHDPGSTLASHADITGLSIPTTAQITTAVLTTQMTESYAALHVAPTLAQAIFCIQQRLIEQRFPGTQASTTTDTVYMVGGPPTGAYVLTIGLDSSGNAISSTRSA
jgi:hypothetical protein